MPTAYVFMENKKNVMLTPLIDLELCISTRMMAKIRMNILSTSRLLVDDQSVLQNSGRFPRLRHSIDFRRYIVNKLSIELFYYYLYDF